MVRSTLERSLRHQTGHIPSATVSKLCGPLLWTIYLNLCGCYYCSTTLFRLEQRDLYEHGVEGYALIWRGYPGGNAVVRDALFALDVILAVTQSQGTHCLPWMSYHCSGTSWVHRLPHQGAIAAYRQETSRIPSGNFAHTNNKRSVHCSLSFGFVTENRPLPFTNPSCLCYVTT